MESLREAVDGLDEQLRSAAAAVAAYGSSSADFAGLSDERVLEARGPIADLRRLSDTYSAFLSGTISARSRRELGGNGLSARQGFVTPEAMVQHATGTTRGDAAKLVAAGILMAETDTAEKAAHEAGRHPHAHLPVPVPWQAPLVHAVTAGVLSVDAADAVRRGLGDTDASVTAEKLATALTRVLTEAPTLTTDQLFKRARRLRDELDEAGIAAREKQARDDTRFTVFRRGDGMVAVNALLAPEQGEWWMSTFDCVTSPRRGGVRFVDPEKAAWAARIQGDPRTLHQIAADAFTDLLHQAAEVDPGRVFGGRRPAVRVIVTQKALTEQTGHALLEGNPAPVSWQTVQREICDAGWVDVSVDTTGRALDVGRTQRFFTPKQRIALGVRDGGCLWPGYDQPPSFTEVHHLNEWATDHGDTDIDLGCLLCRRDHLRLHNDGWRIRHDNGRYWLRPPPSIDPEQALIPLPSKNPLMLALHDTDNTA